MLRKLRERIQSEEKGFTLIELLVVMLIIGILAAIALPVFLGQQDKGRDASAKSNVRNLVSHVESCYADQPTSYASCTTSAQLGTTGLSLVTGQPADDQVSVTASSTNTFTVTGKSKSGNYFSIIKASGGTLSRDCGKDYVASGAHTTDGSGGCPTGGGW